MAVGCERAKEELHSAGRGVDGRLRQVLLRTDRQRIGKAQRIPFLDFAVRSVRSIKTEIGRSRKLE